MGEYLSDDIGIFDAGDDLDGATRVTGLDVNLEYPPQTLRPSHRGSAFHDSSRIVDWSNTQRNDLFRFISDIQSRMLNFRFGSEVAV
jgi:hypothetical protein